MLTNGLFQETDHLSQGVLKQKKGAGNRHEQRVGSSSGELTGREKEGGRRERMENSLNGTPGSIVTWDVRSAAI